MTRNAKLLLILLTLVVSSAHAFDCNDMAQLAAPLGPEVRPYLSWLFIPSELRTARAARHYFEENGVELVPTEGERIEIARTGDHPLNRLADQLGTEGVSLVYDADRLLNWQARGAFDPSSEVLFLAPRKRNVLRPLLPTDFHELIHVRTTLATGNGTAGHSFAAGLRNGGKTHPDLEHIGYGEHMGIDEIAAHVRQMRILIGLVKLETKSGRSPWFNGELGELVRDLRTAAGRPLPMAEALRDAAAAAGKELDESDGKVHVVYTSVFREQTSVSMLDRNLKLNIGTMGRGAKFDEALAGARVRRQLGTMERLSAIVIESQAVFKDARAIGAGVSTAKAEALQKRIQALDDAINSLFNSELEK